ncbi:MAG: phosphodiester glycosidase family protein [Clostridiales Family XIII bacterium]|nr:phosphodiester glycosidase family protein [Clostridiales Family XIII bacterium]
MSTAIGHDGSVYEVVVDQLDGIDVAGLEKEFAELMSELGKYMNYSEFGEEAEQLLRNDVIYEICQRHGWQYSRRYYYER